MTRTLNNAFGLGLSQGSVDFDKPMKAAIGRSLKDDDKPTYVDVNVLFETRNRIAHRGEQPTPDEARAAVKAAEAAVAWLSELRGSGLT